MNLIIIGIIIIFLVVLVKVLRNFRKTLNVLKTLPRDLKLLCAITKFSIHSLWLQYMNQSTDKQFLKWVKKHPFKVALQYNDQKWTFLEIAYMSNQIANLLLRKGYRRGQTVALYMESCPDFVITWLALTKIGVISALINTNLRKTPLKHCITAANCTAVIYSSETKEGILEIMNTLPDLEQWYLKAHSEESVDANVIDIRKELIHMPTDLDSIYNCNNWSDINSYIYTSGTTGLPKAALISHSRYLRLACGAKYFLDLKSDDNIYTTLPLYHSAGNVAGVGLCVMCGVTVTIRKKFSASNFWKDCVTYNCTMAQYIGELCRYLLLTPEQPEYEKKHKVRKMYGNGLKPQIWSKFRERFQVKHIVELYGATEGNILLVNMDGTIGAVGFIPLLIKDIMPAQLVKYDKENNNEPVRNEHGFCLKCDFNEPGLLIGKISDKISSTQFSGYVDQNETQKKILNRVFAENDHYFNTGDILVMNELGYVSFKDRLGDTFRWKGENVSTSEVENIISKIVQFEDVLVYGAKVPHMEGRVGMAAILDTYKKLNLETFAKDLKSNLPSYAVPIFLRMLHQAPITGTFKLCKTDLQKQGFDVNVVKDKLYFLDSKLNKFVDLDQNLYEQILGDKIRF